MTAGDIYTVAGSATGLTGASGQGGPASAARLDSPETVGVDADGDLFLAAAGSDALLEVTATATPAFALAPQPADLTVTQPGGAEVTFTPQSGGSCAAGLVTAGGYCVPPVFEGAALTDNTSAQTYTFSPGPGSDTMTYSWGGELVAEADTAADTLTVKYGTPAPGAGNCPASAAYCVTVTSASGRALVVGGNASGLVTSVTDPMPARTPSRAARTPAIPQRTCTTPSAGSPRRPIRWGTRRRSATASARPPGTA